MTRLLVARSGQWVKAGRPSIPFATATGRENLVLGVDKPTAANTGVLPGTTLTRVTSAAGMPGGGVIPGATYENLDLEFVVTPPTGTLPIIFRNCRFRGTASQQTSDVGLIKLYNSDHAPVEMYDCTFDAQTPHRWWNGIHGYGFKAVRCDLSRVIDAFNVFRPTAMGQNGPLNVDIRQCYIHDQWWVPNPPETRHVDGAHPDGVQLQGGSGFTFLGNNVQAYLHPDAFNTYYNTNHANAIMMIKPDVGVITDVRIQLNWFNGGAAGLNITHDDPRFSAYLGIINSNRFGRGMRNGATWAINRQNTSITWDDGTSGTFNVYEDDGTRVPIRTGSVLT